LPAIRYGLFNVMDALHDSVSDRYSWKMFSACCNNTATSSVYALPSTIIKGPVLEAYLTHVAVPIQRHLSSISICQCHTALFHSQPVHTQHTHCLRAIDLEPVLWRTGCRSFVSFCGNVCFINICKEPT
jgi:hypothetical protein